MKIFIACLLSSLLCGVGGEAGWLLKVDRVVEYSQGLPEQGEPGPHFKRE